MDIDFKRRDAHRGMKSLHALRLPNGFVGGTATLVRPMAFLLIVLCASSVFAQENQGVEAAIRALEHEWVEGQSHNDNHLLDLIFDNSLMYVEYGRLVTKSEYLLRIKDAGPQINQIVMEPMIVRTFGTTAIAIGTYRERDVQGGKPQLRRWRFVDTWVYKAHGWVLVAAAAAPVTEK
jgi:hypothetical protein